jgi:hypothetical protein
VESAIAVTPEELALLRLPAEAELPRGGEQLTLALRSGHGSASTWTYLFGPSFYEQFGITFWPGSLNLWGPRPITWDRPYCLVAGGVTGQFCPVILEEVAVGVAFRAQPFTLEYLEVLSPVELRPRLGGLQDEQMVRVRLLSGDLLGPAA